MGIQAVIWDLGGVLLRTEDSSPRQNLANRLKVSRFELERIVFSGESGKRAQQGKISSDQHWENIRMHFGIPDEEMQAFQENFWGGDRVDTLLVEEIRALRRHAYKSGLLSNAFSDLREVLTHEWKLLDAFDEMVISAEVHLVKPDKRIYRLALKRLGVEPAQAVFIDDMLENVDGARRVGMKGIQFQNREQALGELHKLLDGRA